MSLPMDLDDYPDEALSIELIRRQLARLRGKCDYCNGAANGPSCRYSDRHALASKIRKRASK